jgi:hypothetical protein
MTSAFGNWAVQTRWCRKSEFTISVQRVCGILTKPNGIGLLCVVLVLYIWSVMPSTYAVGAMEAICEVECQIHCMFQAWVRFFKSLTSAMLATKAMKQNHTTTVIHIIYN